LWSVLQFRSTGALRFGNLGTWAFGVGWREGPGGCGKKGIHRAAGLRPGLDSPFDFAQGKLGRLSPHELSRWLGDGGDWACGADEYSSAGGVGADGIEFYARFPGRADAGWVFGRAEIEDKFGGSDEQADVSLVLTFVFRG